MAWSPVAKESPCPVCGELTGCVTGDDQVWCSGTPKRTPVGWAMLYKIGGGKLYNRAGAAAGGEDDPDSAKRTDKAARAAGAVWRRGEGGGNRKTYLGIPPGCLDGCGEDHPRARAWVEALGFSVASLADGVVPSTIRYCGNAKRLDPRSDGFEELPAVLCAAVDRHDRVRGVQQFYLSIDGGGDPIDHGPPEAWVGSNEERTGGVVIKLAPRAPRTGLLVLALGVASGLAIDTALRDAGVEAAVWISPAAKDMRAWRLQPWQVAEISPDGWVTQVLIACDSAIESKGDKLANEWAHRCGTELAASWGARVHVRVCEAPAESVTWAAAVRSLGSELGTERLLAAASRQRMLEKEEEERAKPLIIGDTSVEISHQVLEGLFHPKEPGGSWGWQYYADKHWIRQDSGVWKEQSDKKFRSVLRHFLCQYQVSKGKDLVAFDPSQRDMTEIIEAMVALASPAGEVMNQWLTESLDQEGEPTWKLTILRNSSLPKGPIDAEKVIACEDGMLDLDAWVQGKRRIIPLSSRWFTRSVLPFRLNEMPWEYADQLRDADLGGEDAVEILKEICPTAHRFMLDVLRDPQRLRAVAEYAGLALTSIIKFQTILWMQGMPGTGKGTMVGLIKEVIGRENTFDTSWSKLGGRFDSNLVGKNLVVLPEFRVDRRDNSAEALSRLLSWSAGDSQSVEAKYKDQVDNIMPTAKWMITPNDDLGLRDTSGAIMRRLLIVRAEPRPQGAVEDRDLPMRLNREASGVFFLLVCALRDLLRRGRFIQPVVDSHIKGEMLAEMSPVVGFIQSVCVRAPQWGTPVDELLREFNEWRKGRAPSHHEWSVDALNANLRAAFPDIRKVDVPVAGGVASYWVGVRPVRPLELTTDPWSGDGDEHDKCPTNLERGYLNRDYRWPRATHVLPSPPPPPVQERFA